VGAEDRQILVEYVTEAGLMGLLGGLAGLGTGWLMTLLLNAVAAPSLGGTDLWLVTPRLVVTALAFSTGLGAAAGLYPAWRASRLDPVEALRAE
jgi:putative ABC transport system permease protein